MNSFISWAGGKHLLKKEIVKRFPQQKNDYYVEVFGGAGWVLFYKERINGETEVYNDLNGELVNLFRCVKYHCDALQQELQFVLNSRKIFDRYKNTDTEYLTDIQRAAHFFMLIRMSYAAKGVHYGCIKSNIGTMVDYLKDIEKRLQTVCIENKSFNNIIDSFKNKKAFFYLDPPYYETENLYTAKLRGNLNRFLPRFFTDYFYHFLCGFFSLYVRAYNQFTHDRFLLTYTCIIDLCIIFPPDNV